MVVAQPKPFRARLAESAFESRRQSAASITRRNAEMRRDKSALPSAPSLLSFVCDICCGRLSHARFNRALGLIALAASARADTCVFLGNSITQGVRTEAKTVTAEERFSFLIAGNRGCREINVGVPSDTAAGMIKRFERDVAANSPSLGDNENDYWPDHNITVEMSEKNLRSIIDRARRLNRDCSDDTTPDQGYWAVSRGA